MKPLACLLRVMMSAAPMLLLAGCSDATLFRSNFDETAIDQPPAVTQGVGRCRSGPTRQRLGSGRPRRVERQMAAVATP